MFANERQESETDQESDDGERRDADDVAVRRQRLLQLDEAAARPSDVSGVARSVSTVVDEGLFELISMESSAPSNPEVTGSNPCCCLSLR